MITERLTPLHPTALRIGGAVRIRTTELDRVLSEVGNQQPQPNAKVGGRMYDV